MFLTTPTLHTDRLRLRPFTDADAEPLFALHSNATVLRYWDSPPWTDRARADRFIAICREMANEGTGARVALDRLSDGTFIGWCGLVRWNPNYRSASLGYCIDDAAWGQGYATEAAWALLEWAFETLDLNRVQAETDTRNLASARVLEKIGFVREGTLREDCIVDGDVSDSWVYGLIRRDWAAAAQPGPRSLSSRHTRAGASSAQGSFRNTGPGEFPVTGGSKVRPVIRTFSVVAALVAVSAVAASAGVAAQHSRRPCSLSGLKLEVGGLVSEKTGGQATLPLVLTSRAATPCLLDGYPSISLFDWHARLLRFKYRHNGDEMITGALPKPVPMQRGTSAYFALNKTGCNTRTTRDAHMLRLAIPGSTGATGLSLQHEPVLNYCGQRLFRLVAVSPFERKRNGWACLSQTSCQRRRK